MANLKYYCYAFSFVSEEGYHSSFSGFIDKKVTADRIEEARVSSKAPTKSVLLSVSYLGFMTEEQLRGKKNA